MKEGTPILHNDFDLIERFSQSEDAMYIYFRVYR